MKIRSVVCAVVALGSLALGAPAVAGSAQSYLVKANSENLPRGLEQRIAAAGGEITRMIPEVGIVVVRSSNPDFAAQAGRAAGVRSVLPNLTVQFTEPMQTIASGFTTDSLDDPPFSGSADFFFDLQWGHTAIGATRAWAEGRRGAGARVAVLDGGFDLAHPDLMPNINFALSTNFVEGESLQYGLPDAFSHGAHVAGTIAAAENDFGIIGVAPDAELVLVKVIGDAGSGSFADVISGIVHAANVGADVINMSFGANLPKSGIFDEDGNRIVGANEVADLLNAVSRATNYAYRRGVTLISSAGNEQMDSNRARDVVSIPSQSSHVIAISATAPIGWATDPLNTSFTNLASYSNFGKSHVDFAAPGGDFIYPGDELCLIAGILNPCWVFDLVFSAGNQSWYWSAGTSMAAPHAAGVAALIIGANGGSMHPAQVESVLRATALKIDTNGRSAFFGHGQVNAAN